MTTASMEDVERDEEREKIVGEEEKVLGRVQKHLTARELDKLVARTTDYDKELLALRDQIAEARTEDVPPLIQEMERLQQVANRRAESSTGIIDAKSPYFGRMVLIEGEKKREVLIGRATYLDPRTGTTIVDWRDAPVSRLYYRFDEGDDYEETFGGRDVEGEIVTRRSLAIVDGALRRIVSPQGTFIKRDRGSWERAGASATRLSGGAGKAERPSSYRKGAGKLGVGRDGDGRVDKHLPEIAALIDPRQFDLITKPSSGLVVIQGGAGSGKTTIGLHRMAYLAFQEPKRFRPDKMLILVFNTALARYISRVLPALDVEGVAVATYQDWAEKLRQTQMPRVPRRYTADTPGTVVRLKKHPAMLAHIDRIVSRIETRFEETLEEHLRGVEGSARVWTLWKDSHGKPIGVRVQALSRIAAGTETGGPSLQTAQKHAVEKTVGAFRNETSDVIGAWAEMLTNRAFLEETFAAHGSDFASSDFDEVIAWCGARCHAVTTEMEERAVEAEGKREEREGGGPRESRRPGRSEEEEAPARDDDEDEGRYVAIDGRDEREEDRAEIDREDDTLLLRLWQRMRGRLRRGKDPLSYEHIFVDEAQDLSPVEMAVVVGTANADKSITLAGDTAQRLHMDNGFSDWKHVLETVGLTSADSAVSVEPLKISYRSTREIITLAKDVLGPLGADYSGHAIRDGAPVELFRFAHSGDAVGFLGEALRDLVRAEPLASIALVARYPEQADIYFKGLENAEVPNLRRVADQDFSFKAGVDVTDVRQVKGLEFDYVVLLEVTDAAYPPDDEARHLLHIAATRAAHQLWITSTGTPSRLLPEELRERGF